MRNPPEWFQRLQRETDIFPGTIRNPVRKNMLHRKNTDHLVAMLDFARRAS
jgi:hypothetical protein